MTDRRTRVLTMRVEPELVERLEDESSARVVSRNFLIVRLLTEGLDRLRPVEEFTLTRPPKSQIEAPALPRCATPFETRSGDPWLCTRAAGHDGHCDAMDAT